MKIIYVSTYPPRACGIATFARDLINTIEKVSPKIVSEIVAVNQDGGSYDYEPRVKFQIKADDETEYFKLASLINDSEADLVNIQHEFGIYGGSRGEYILSLLRTIKKPVITTLHTIVPQSSQVEKTIIRDIINYSTYVIVMAKKAVQILKKVYRVSTQKIRVIPHGAPGTTKVLNYTLDEFLAEYSDRTIISTFGLIGEGKGLEYVIMAMPEVVKKYPTATYFVIGQTHPEIIKREGERYRLKLAELIKDLKLENNVKFLNKYLTLEEIIHCLQVTDIYITPYLNPDQITSGTLAYALSCGKAIISTPYLYAEEVLASGRGLLVKFKDPGSTSLAINMILGDKKLKKNMEKKVYAYSRKMLWPNVGKKYFELFKRGVKIKIWGKK